MKLEAIPREIRERRQWVLWRYEERDGKPTKVPYTTAGERASSTDPATWTTFEEVCASGDGDGIGFVFSADDPYAGIDLDDCFVNGDLHPSALKIVQALDSYTERSVSGTGLHVLVRAELNGSRRRTGKTPWGAPFETYDRDRYFCMTGELLAGAAPTIENRQAQLERVLGVVFPAQSAPRSPAPRVPLDDRDLLDRAFAARNGAKLECLYRGDVSGYGSASEADLALCSILAFWTGADPERIDQLFRGSGLMREKWERDDYREKTISAALEGRSDYFSEQSRGSDSVDSVTEFDRAEGRNGVTESPYKGLRSDSVAPVDAETEPQGSDSVDSVPFALPLRDFLTERSDSPSALIGDESEVILPTAGLMLLFAKGGRGKTTLTIDLALHLASGVEWLGFEIPRPLRVLFIENEGPREPFRAKLEARLAGWEPEIPDTGIFFHTLQWGAFTFADHEHARLSFPKVRWNRRGSRPAYILSFDPETESFALAHEEEDEERDYLAEIAELMSDKKPRIAKEIAAPKKSGGIGANEKLVTGLLEKHPDRFVSCTGDEAKALKRSPLATVWLLAKREDTEVWDYADEDGGP